MEKCKCIGTLLFLYNYSAHELEFGKNYYYNKTTHHYSDPNQPPHIQYEIYNIPISFITSISKDEFDKKFITLKKERKLKLNKLNGSVR